MKISQHLAGFVLAAALGGCATTQQSSSVEGFAAHSDCDAACQGVADEFFAELGRFLANLRGALSVMR